MWLKNYTRKRSNEVVESLDSGDLPGFMLQFHSLMAV